MRHLADRSPERVAYPVVAQIAVSQAAYAWPLDDQGSISGVSSLTFKQVAGERIALIPRQQSDWIEFQGYAQAWKRSRPKGVSSAMLMAADLNYFNIINMSERAVPCLLHQLENELANGDPDHWFIALWITTKGANPVPPKSRGNMREMARAWIEWGKKEGLLDAGMGSRIATSW
jgi:hypothetical protein